MSVSVMEGAYRGQGYTLSRMCVCVCVSRAGARGQGAGVQNRNTERLQTERYHTHQRRWGHRRLVGYTSRYSDTKQAKNRQCDN